MTRIYIGIAAAVLALLAIFGYGNWRADKATAAENQRWELAVGKIKTEAATKLGGETLKVLALERELGEIKTTLEGLYETRRLESLAAGKRLADVIAAGRGRLRDPNATGCGGGGGGAPAAVAGSAGGGAQDRADAGGVLSAQLSGLLQRDTGTADTINDAYALCRAWTVETVKKFNEGEAGKQQLSPP